MSTSENSSFQKLPQDVAARMQAIIDRHAKQYREDLPGLLERMEAQVAEISDQDRWQEAMPTLKREAHDMKGQAATFGLPMLSSICQSLCQLLEHGQWSHPNYAETVREHVEALSLLTAMDDPALVDRIRVKGLRVRVTPP